MTLVHAASGPRVGQRVAKHPASPARSASDDVSRRVGNDPDRLLLAEPEAAKGEGKRARGEVDRLLCGQLLVENPEHAEVAGADDLQHAHVLAPPCEAPRCNASRNVLAHALVQVVIPGVYPVVAAQHDGGAPRVGYRQLHVGTHAAHHSVGGVGDVFIGFAHPLFHFHQDEVGDRGCQRFLVREVVVKTPLGNTGTLHDFVDGDRINRVLEQ